MYCQFWYIFKNFFFFYNFQGESRDYRNDQAQYEDTGVVMGKSYTSSKLFLDCVDEASEGVYTCVGETPTERITQSTNLVISKYKIKLNYSVLCFYTDFINVVIKLINSKFFFLGRPNGDLLDLPEAAAEQFSHRTCLEKRSVGSTYQNDPFSYLFHMTKHVIFEQI